MGRERAVEEEIEAPVEALEADDETPGEAVLGDAAPTSTSGTADGSRIPTIR